MVIPVNYIYNSAILEYNENMDLDFSRTDQPMAPISVALSAVYVLYADPTYDVRKGGLITRDLVALRTIEGSGCIILEEAEDIVVTSGTILFFEHQKVKRYYCNTEKWNFWWFEFENIGNHFIPLNKIINLSLEDDEMIYFNHCLEYLRKEQKLFSQIASSFFSLVLQHWLLHCAQSGPQNLPHEIAIEKVIDYMKVHLSENITIGALSNQAGLSERRFRQIFKDITGMQPKKYLDELRLRMAEELLINTPLPIGYISTRLGYSSQFHFSKAFKKRHGIPPSMFRKKSGNPG